MNAERSVLLAWAVGLGLLTWRELRAHPWRPPPPGRYLAASGLYAVLGVAAASQHAARPAVLIAWGFDLAVALQALGGTVTTLQQTNQQPGGGTIA